MRRRKKDVRVSLWYRFAFLAKRAWGLGDAEGIMAGRGIDGAGDADRRIAGEELPKEDRLLEEAGGGGIGKAEEAGVPGAEGAGDAAGLDDASEVSRLLCEKSGGAGLFDVLLLDGWSILCILPC